MLKKICASAIAVTLFAGAAYAQSANPQLVEMGGSMHALANLCGGYTQAELTKLKADQKKQAEAAGMASAVFEQHFKAGFDKSTARIANATPADKDKACKQAKQMMAMGQPQ